MPTNPSSSYEFRKQTVKLLMLLRKQTVSGMARHIGVTPATVCMVISGKTQSKRVQNAIAQLLGVNKETLWS